jgi:ABC-type transport system involved in multi-copper enzyme maturation permease subunit
MNLVMHILKADLRRFFWPITLWTVLTIAATVYEGFVPRLATQDQVWPFILLSVGLLWIARMILAAAIVVQIVQAHSTIGSQAFWLTRPIPRGVLVIAKILLALGVTVGIPAVADTILMGAYDVPMTDIMKIVGEWSLTRAVGTLIVMVIAAQTRSLAQFALACGGVLAAVAVASSLLAGWVGMTSRGYVGMLTLASADRAYDVNARWPDATPTLVVWVVVLAASFLALWSQYRRRLRHRSIAVQVAGFVLAGVVAITWPWPLLYAEPRIPSWAATDGLRLAAPPQALWFDHGGFRIGNAPRWHTATAQMHVQGVASGWFASARLLRGTVVYDGRTLESGPSPGSVVLSAARALPSTMKVALTEALDIDVVRDGFDTSSRLPVFVVNHEDLPTARTRASYEGAFQVDLHHLEVARVLPLTEGATFQEGAYRFRIERLEAREGGPRIAATVSTGFSLLDRQTRPHYSMYLRNPRTREAIEGHKRSATSHLRQRSLMMLGPFAPLGTRTGFFADAYEIRFASTYGAQLPSALSPDGSFRWTDDEWLASAELVILRTTHGGRVTRTLRIPEVALNGGTNVKLP